MLQCLHGQMQPFIQVTSPCIYMSKKEDTGEERSGWMFGDGLTHEANYTVQWRDETPEWKACTTWTGQDQLFWCPQQQRLSMWGRRGKDPQTTERDVTSCMPGRAKPWEASRHTLPPQTHDSIHHRGELKVKSDKRISQQTTEKEPGLCQIMAGFKRNEFFLPGD